MIHEVLTALMAAAPGPVAVTAPPVAAAAASAASSVASSASGGILSGGLAVPAGGDLLGVGHGVALPLMNSALVLIPAAVALMSLHKLLDHRETGAGFLVEMLTKAGGAILIIELVKNLTGLS